MKKYRRVMSHDTEEWLKVRKKTEFGPKNYMKNLVNLMQAASSAKSENFHFDVLSLSIPYKVSTKKVHKNYLSSRA